MWDFNKHASNATFIKEQLEGKLVVVAMAGLETEHLTADFLADFRTWTQTYRYSLNKYAFALFDLDDEPMFNYLTSFSLGRFDSPGVFVINGTDFARQQYFRTYHTYYSGGTNFANISEQLVVGVNTGTKLPLYSHWVDALLNVKNLEHWANNKMKAYIYVIGLSSMVIIPLIVLVDCFVPVLGRGPRQQKREKQE